MKTVEATDIPVIGITTADIERGLRWVSDRGFTTEAAVEQYMAEPEYWQRRFAALGYIEDALALLSPVSPMEKAAKDALAEAWDALVGKR